MRRSRFTEPQIMALLRQAESGVAVSELCRERGISTASFYKWRSKYGGMDASMMSQMKALDRAMVRHWSEDNGEGEPAAEAHVHRAFGMQAELLNCEGERHRFERT